MVQFAGTIDEAYRSQTKALGGGSTLSLNGLNYGAPGATQTKSTTTTGSTGLTPPGTPFSLITPTPQNSGLPNRRDGKAGEYLKSAAYATAATAGLVTIGATAYAGLATAGFVTGGLVGGQVGFLAAAPAVFSSTFAGAMGATFGAAGSLLVTAATFLATNPIGWGIGIGVGLYFGVKALWNKFVDPHPEWRRDSNAIEIFNGTRKSGDGEQSKLVMQMVNGKEYPEFFVRQKRLTQNQANYLVNNGGFTRDSVTDAVAKGIISAAQGKEVVNVMFYGLTTDGKIATVDTPKTAKLLSGVIDLFEDKNSSGKSQANFIALHLEKFTSLEAAAKSSRTA